MKHKKHASLVFKKPRFLTLVGGQWLVNKAQLTKVRVHVVIKQFWAFLLQLSKQMYEHAVSTL